MGILRGLLLAFIASFILSCAGPQYRSQGIPKAPEVPAAYVDINRLNDLHAGVARFDVYALIPELSKDPIPVGSGSAWCIAQMSNYSLWVTCRHVAELAANEIAGISYLDREKKPKQATVYDIRLSAESDVAVFKSNSRPGYTFQLGTSGLVRSLTKEPKDLLATAGFPHTLFPAFITIGFFESVVSEVGDGMILTDVAGTHGNSGSPVVHLRTMQVVGMVSRFNGERFQNQFRTDRILAVHPYHINRALLELARK